MSLIAGRGCRWPPRRDSVSPCAPLSGGRDTHDGHENSPILVFFSNLLGMRIAFSSRGGTKGVESRGDVTNKLAERPHSRRGLEVKVLIRHSLCRLDDILSKRLV